MIADNIARVQERVAAACARSNRDPSDVRVLLATKTITADRIRQAYAAGIRLFGENRVQEFTAKYPELPDDCVWHFIGHLQTNKVKYIADHVEMVHSLDRYRLAEALNSTAEKRNRVMAVLVEVNTSREETKCGVAPGQVHAFLASLAVLRHIAVCGFMTVGPMTDDQARIREAFRELRSVRDSMRERFSDLKLNHLSMGMSADYEIAVEEGATILRLGTVIWGERQYATA